MKVQNGNISETYCLIVFKNNPPKSKCLKIKSWEHIAVFNISPKSKTVLVFCDSLDSSTPDGIKVDCPGAWD